MTWIPRRLTRFFRKDTSLSRIARNTGWLLAGKALGAVLSLVYLAMMTRSLGPTRFGEFTLILGLAQAITSFVAFQTWRLVIRLGTQPLLDKDHRKVGRLIWFCALIDICGAVVGCVIAVTAVWLLAGHFGWSHRTALYAVCFAFVSLLTARSTAVGTLRLHDQFRNGAAADAVTPIARMIGATIVLLMGASVDGFLIAWAVGEVATFIAYWYVVLTRTGVSIRGYSAREIVTAGRDHPGFWRFAAFTNLNSTFSSISQQVAVLSVGLVAGPAAAGFFRLAHQLGQALLLLADMLGRSLYAEMARVWASSTQEAMTSLLTRTSKIALIAGVCVIALVVVAGLPALHLIGGAAYTPAYPLLVLLGGAAAVQLVGVSFEPVLTATDRAGTVLWIRIVGTIILLALLTLLLPRYGPIGAGFAMLTDACVLLALLGTMAWRVTHRPRKVAA